MAIEIVSFPIKHGDFPGFSLDIPWLDRPQPVEAAGPSKWPELDFTAARTKGFSCVLGNYWGQAEVTRLAELAMAQAIRVPNHPQISDHV